jgi:hypothetical protein
VSAAAASATYVWGMRICMSAATVYARHTYAYVWGMRICMSAATVYARLCGACAYVCVGHAHMYVWGMRICMCAATVYARLAAAASEKYEDIHICRVVVLRSRNIQASLYISGLKLITGGASF